MHVLTMCPASGTQAPCASHGVAATFGSTTDAPVMSAEGNATQDTQPACRSGVPIEIGKRDNPREKCG